MKTFFYFLFFMLCLLYASSSSAQADLEIQVGESLTLPFPDLGRVAVGSSKVINASSSEDNHVLVFGKSPGSSSLMLWNKHGGSKQYWIHVTSGDNRRVQQELIQFLKRIPSVRAEQVGDKVIIEGESISDQDRSRIAILVKRYPQIVDFTNYLGWEKMVLMDVRVLEVPKTKIHELGVNWDTNSTGGLAAGISWDIGASPTVWSRPGESPIDTAYPTRSLAGYLGSNMLWMAKIQAMEKNGDAIVLAAPQLSTRSGSTASFKAGGEVPYGVTDKNGASNTVFKSYGVVLDITPSVGAQGLIRSLIQVEVSSVDPSISTASGPALKTRRTETEFNLKLGETLVLSGFLQAEESREESAVPGLSKIPLLGQLFRSERIQRKETELIIFVTPHVVDESDKTHKSALNEAQRRIEALNPNRGFFDQQTPSIDKSRHVQATPLFINKDEASSPLPKPVQDSHYVEKVWN